MAQITVILRERHGNRYRPGELVRMSEDCFYVGLLPKNCPMVVHLKDQPHTTPLDLLKALLEQEENNALTHTRYPPSMSSRMSQPSKPVERYHRHLPAEKRNDGYTVRPAQLDADPTEAVPKADSVPLTDTMDTLETWYNDRFLIGLHQAAEVSELRHGCCFNCQKEGHHWHKCKEPLSPELQEVSDQQDREREDRKKTALNPRGGMGMKGGHAPIPLVESARHRLRHPALLPSRQCIYWRLSLQILEWGCPLQVAGPRESGLGHLGQCPYPGVGRQWCESQLSDTSLRPPAQIRGVPNIRVGPYPQPLPGPYSTCRIGQWMGGAFGLHPDEGSDRRHAPLWWTASHFCPGWPQRVFRQGSGHPGYPYYQQGHANYEGDRDA